MTIRMLVAGLLLAGATTAISQGATAIAQGATTAIAQNTPAPDSPSNGGAGIRSGNITSTGATVPNPGASQSGGTTPMDKGIQERDNKIDSSICKGC